jgi:hypothetical protein
VSAFIGDERQGTLRVPAIVAGYGIHRAHAACHKAVNDCLGNTRSTFPPIGELANYSIGELSKGELSTMAWIFLS